MGDRILIGQHQGSWPNRGLDQGPNRGLAGVFEHLDDHLAAASDHAENRGLLLGQRTASRAPLRRLRRPFRHFLLPRGVLLSLIHI